MTVAATPARASHRVPGGGPRVLVTRPAEQAAGWVADLQAHGIDAVALPLLGIAPAADPAPVDAAWQALGQFALVMFVSPNAALRFFDRRPAGQAWPASVDVATPGPGTGEALRALGVPAARMIEPAADAAQFDSEALWLQLRKRPWSGRRVLIVRGEGGREWLAEQLLAAGARVDFVAAYQRGPALLDDEARAVLQQALDAPAQHRWLFSSSEAIDHLATLAALPPERLGQALQASTALATHPRIAERAVAAGFGQVHLCRADRAAVVACIQSPPPPKPLGEPHART